MNREKLAKLKELFEKRGGAFWATPDAPAEVTVAFVDALLACPDCRAAVLEASNEDERKDVDIEATIRRLAMRGVH